VSLCVVRTHACLRRWTHRFQITYSKGVSEHTSHAAALHLAVANLYPAGQAMSSAVASLAGSGKVLHDSQTASVNVATALDAACNSIISRCKELTALADQRQVARLEMQHYREKVRP
jgi:hypothetical protein